MRVLHLTSSYPSAVDPGAAGFLRDHVLASARVDDPIVVALVIAPARGALRRPFVERGIDHGVPTTRVYLLCIPVLRLLVLLLVALPVALAALRRGRPNMIHLHAVLSAGPLAVLLSAVGGGALVPATFRRGSPKDDDLYFGELPGLLRRRGLEVEWLAIPAWWLYPVDEIAENIRGVADWVARSDRCRPRREAASFALRSLRESAGDRAERAARRRAAIARAFQSVPEEAVEAFVGGWA